MALPENGLPLPDQMLENMSFGNLTYYSSEEFSEIEVTLFQESKTSLQTSIRCVSGFPGRSGLIHKNWMALVRFWIAPSHDIALPVRNESVIFSQDSELWDLHDSDAIIAFAGGQQVPFLELTLPLSFWQNLPELVKSFDQGRDKTNVIAYLEYSTNIPKGLRLILFVEVKGMRELLKTGLEDPSRLLARVADMLG